MPQTLFDPNDPDVKEVLNFEIFHKDVFHMKNLYKMVHDWLVENNFVSSNPVAGRDHYEIMYYEKQHTPEMSEHFIWWRAQKEPDGSNYIKFYIKIDFQTLALKSVNLQKDGNQIAANKGEVIIRGTAYMSLDYKRYFKDNALLNLFHNRFKTKWRKKMIDAYENELWLKMYELQSTIKQFLKLKNPRQVKKAYYPEKGI